MENSLFIGLSRQAALQAQMDLVANNIANISTPGYRSQNMVFTEYLAKPDGYRKVQEPLSMVMDYGQYQNTGPGPIRQTGNPLDVAIQGRGWFGIQTPSGTMYTRAGNFQLNNNGEIITGSGLVVAGDGGGSITIPTESKEIRIAEDGTVATDKGLAGKLMVVEFADDQQLEAAGNGLYKAHAGTQEPTNSRIAQGYVEGSNVNPILETTRMIDVLRAYQSTQRMLQGEHDRERSMIQRLSSPR